VVVAKLLGGAAGPFLTMQLAPAAAGVRGGEPAARYFEAGEAQVGVAIQPNVESPGRLDLQGLITGGNPASYSVHVYQDGRFIVTVPVDEGGNFVVGNLAHARYALVLSYPGQKNYIEELTI
jgi:hypothetical protein